MGDSASGEHSMNRALVTVMIPTYNQADIVAETIESALRQDYPCLQVLIGDDNSSDSTENAVKPFLNDARVQYIKNAVNLGRVGNYRNLLYGHARGTYVLNLDGDDVLTDSSFIRRAMDLVDANPDLAIVAGRHQVFHSIDELTFDVNAKSEVSLWEGWTFLEKYWTSAFFSLFHLSTLYHRGKALELDFYRLNSIASDTDSLLRMLPGNKLAILDGVVGGWREHGGNESGAPKIKDQLEVLDAVRVTFDSLQASYPDQSPLLRTVCKRMQIGILRAGLDLFYRRARHLLPSYRNEVCVRYPEYLWVCKKWQLKARLQFCLNSIKSIFWSRRVSE